jgi:hypothetical protein
MGVAPRLIRHASEPACPPPPNTECMLALAETESVFVPQLGVVTSGDRARGALEQFLAIGPSRALVPTASEVDMSDSTADVARRGPDGWKFIVDNPFGTG